MRQILPIIFLMVLMSLAARGAAPSSLPEVPAVTSDYLAYCPSHAKDCDTYTMGIGLTLAINNTLASKQGYCGNGNSDNHAVAVAVTGWLQSHSETGARPTSDAVSAALDTLYPCTESADFPSSTKAFLAYCKTHDNDCHDDIFARSLRLVLTGDKKFCLPKDQSDAQLEADIAAIKKELFAKAASLPPVSYDAIENGWRERYPCH